jgi:hypothetical protein
MPGRNTGLVYDYGMASRIRRPVRRAPGSTKSSGYDQAHKNRRAAALARLAASPGQPCARCGLPMYVTQLLDLDHTDDRSGYLGLSHRACNVAASNRSPRRRLSRAVAAPAAAPLRTSRRW